MKVEDVVTDEERDEVARDVPPGAEEAEAQSWNIYEKMFYVQQRLKVGKNRGKGHGGTVNYAYRNAQDIVEAAKPLLRYVGAILNVSVVPKMIGVGSAVDARAIGKDKNGCEVVARVFGPRFVACATARFINIVDGAAISAQAFAEIDFRRAGQTEPEKLCGSADSYASKYALAHLFGLDDGQDADSEGDVGAGAQAAINNSKSNRKQEAPDV